MTNEEFLEQFGHFVDAPNGIQKLRDMILQLAVQGKLLPQDTNDEPANELLKRIQNEKVALIKAKRVSRLKVLPSDEIVAPAFELPSGWSWALLDDITHTVHYGYTASADHNNKDVRLLRITDIQDNKVDWNTVPGCEISEKNYSANALNENDILIARTGGTIGKTYIVENLSVKAVFASYLIRAIPSPMVAPRYLKIFMEAPVYWDQLIAKSAGTGQPNVNATSLRALQVPVAPFKEQHRIVAKVDELMALCDQLEEKQKQRNETHQRLIRAIHHPLTAAADASATQTAWHRIRDNFNDLYATKESVQALRQAILKLAVLGTLFEARNTGNVRKSIVGDYVTFQNGYAFKSSWFVKAGTRLVRNINIGHGNIDWSKEARISLERAEEFGRFNLIEGDIVISLDRPIISTGLKLAKIREQDLPSLLLQRVARAQIDTSKVAPDFFYIWLQSPCFVDFIDPGRSNGVPHISTKQVEKLDFAPPSLDEQYRIVTWVDELMTLCDQLEAQIDARSNTASRYAEAVVQQIAAA